MMTRMRSSQRVPQGVVKVEDEEHREIHFELFQCFIWCDPFSRSSEAFKVIVKGCDIAQKVIISSCMNAQARISR